MRGFYECDHFSSPFGGHCGSPFGRKMCGAYGLFGSDDERFGPRNRGFGPRHGPFGFGHHGHKRGFGHYGHGPLGPDSHLGPREGHDHGCEYHHRPRHGPGFGPGHHHSPRHGPGFGPRHHDRNEDRPGDCHGSHEREHDTNSGPCEHCAFERPFCGPHRLCGRRGPCHRTPHHFPRPGPYNRPGGPQPCAECDEESRSKQRGCCDKRPEDRSCMRGRPGRRGPKGRRCQDSGDENQETILVQRIVVENPRPRSV